MLESIEVVGRRETVLRDQKKKRERDATKPVQKQAFEVFADYYQFSLVDAGAEPDPPSHLTEEDTSARLYGAPNFVTVGTARNDTVPVEMEIQQEEPIYDPDEWDHIAECSLELPSGQLQVVSTDGVAAEFQVPPGCYRVRAFSGGLDTVSGLDGEDRYKVVLWPAREGDRVVIKQYDGDGLA